MKRLVSLLLILGLITTSAVFAVSDKEQTNVVALGDSIAVGLSATDDYGYVNLYFEDLNESDKALKLRNRASSGEMSGDLLESMRHDQHINNKIKKAKIITISIGANDLLGPLVDHVYLFLSEEYHLDMNADDFDEQLIMAIASDPAWEYDTLPRLLASVPDLTGKVVEFNNNLNEIMTLIRGNGDQEGLNPDAQIYMLNLYNPLPVEWMAHPAYGLIYNEFDNLILMMNYAIAMRSMEYGFDVIDVYSSFRVDEDAVKFLDQSILLNQSYFDPHPTDEGHSIIFELHP